MVSEVLVVLFDTFGKNGVSMVSLEVEFGRIGLIICGALLGAGEGMLIDGVSLVLIQLTILLLDLVLVGGKVLNGFMKGLLTVGSARLSQTTSKSLIELGLMDTVLGGRLTMPPRSC